MTTSVQHPLTSGFGPASTAADVIGGIDLTGRVAIVTGGYSGIGLETVRVLRGAGAEIVVTARDLGRARAALQDIDGVEIAQMDLIDAASIRSIGAISTPSRSCRAARARPTSRAVTTISAPAPRSTRTVSRPMPE